MTWTLSHRASPSARDVADRHYNRQKPGTPQFVPPGRCIVLKACLNGIVRAVWVSSWPFARFVKHAWAGAWINSCFRNEGAGLSSDLIVEAVAATRAVALTLPAWEWGRLPALGCISFIDRAKTKHKRDPGRCYLRAGWRYAGHHVVKEGCTGCASRGWPCGLTKGGLVAMQLLPDDMPEPQSPHGLQSPLFAAGPGGGA